MSNWEGGFIQPVTFNLGSALVLVAKATTVRNGVKAAVQAVYKKIHIEGDNKILITSARGDLSVMGNPSTNTRYLVLHTNL